MSCENRKIGIQGEKLARRFLEEKGYEILETNFYCRFGEIDIIARLDGKISFVEVKTRRQIKYGFPAESVTKCKENHIYKIAEFYTYLYSLYDASISFDVIEVYLFRDKNARIEHIKNAIVEKPRKSFLCKGRI
jgi:putative endonuclease